MRDGRFPIAELYAVIGMPSDGEMAMRLGVGRACLSKIRVRGPRPGLLTDLLADRWACALGFHPSLLWPAEWWQGVDQLELELETA